MIDKEKRARELLAEKPIVQAMLQLGREMVDARIEEIAVDAECGTWLNRREIAAHTRSFTSSREVSFPLSKDPFLRERQLIQAARDEAYQRGWTEGLESGRKSVTCVVPRELILETALREAQCSCGGHLQIQTMPPKTIHRQDCNIEIARRALEWTS